MIAKELSKARLLAITVILSGVQFGWALQLALLTPYVQFLGIPHEFASYMWLCGPISGLIVQPVVGVFSDRCRNKYGRRRPFIVGGVIVVIFSQLLISNGGDLGHLMGDNPHAASKPAAIGLVVTGFWLLDVSNNLMMGPCRALLADLAPPSQQNLGNAFFSLWMGVGNVLGYLAGASPYWTQWLPFMVTPGCPTACADLRSCFTISIVFLIITTVITCVAAKEKSLPQIEEEEGQAIEDDVNAEPVTKAPRVNPLRDIFNGVFKADSNMKRICIVNLLSWVGWFTFLLYDTDWMGRTVFGGVPDDTQPNSRLNTQYLAGVHFGSWGLLANSVISWGMSFVVAPLTNKLGAKWVWFGSQVIFTATLASTVAVGYGQQIPALVLFGLLGIPWTITTSLPYALVGMNAREENRGRDMGVLNIFVVVGQLIVAFSCGPLNGAFGNNDAAGFVAGAIASAASLVLIILLIHRNSAKGGVLPGAEKQPLLQEAEPIAEVESVTRAEAPEPKKMPYGSI